MCVAGPSVSGGLKEMKIFKTTQSGFEGAVLSQALAGCVERSFPPGFVRDRFTSLPETNDRPFCTKVCLKYHFYGGAARVDYNGTWWVWFDALPWLLHVVIVVIYACWFFLRREIVKNSVLDIFSGPPHTGAYSPSVQVKPHKQRSDNPTIKNHCPQ